MRKLEIVLICTILFGVIWKLLDYPFGNNIIILSVLILSCLYFCLGIVLFNDIGIKKIFKKESYKGISALRVIGSVWTGMVLSLVLLGILFRLMMWPFASQNLIVGVLGLLVSLVPVFVKFVQKRSDFYKVMFFRTIGYTIVGVSLYFSGTFFLELKYGDYPEYIEVVKKLNEDPNNTELIQQEQELYKQIRFDRTGQR